MIKSIGKFFADTFGQKAGTGNVFHPTDKCPECGSKLIKTDSAGWGERRREPGQDSKNTGGSPGVSPHQTTGDEAEDSAWRCPNLDCPAQIRARIEHWCSPAAMNITGGDAALVALLVGEGLVRDVAELYRLRVAELAALPGMDKGSAQKTFDAITASQKREAWRLLFGLSIPHVGPPEAQSLCRQFASVDNVFAASAERLMKAEGVSEATARSIVHWHSDSVNRKLVRRLFKAGVNFKA
jgi:NAD-dependent DNA ligase